MDSLAPDVVKNLDDIAHEHSAILPAETPVK